MSLTIALNLQKMKRITFLKYETCSKSYDYQGINNDLPGVGVFILKDRCSIEDNTVHFVGLA